MGADQNPIVTDAHLAIPDLSTAVDDLHPSAPDPSTPDPSTPDPSTPDPSTPDPSTPDPSAPDPSTPDPSSPAAQGLARREALASLVRRMQDGDESALEGFIEATQTSAWRLALSLLGDRALAEDCLQDVYFTVHRSIGQLRDPRAAHTWMLRIVTHRCRRLQRRQPVQSLETLLASGQEPVAPDATHAAETRLGIEAAMASLPSPDQEVLTLREMLSLSYEEIAASLAVPLGTVRSRLAKARQRLISALRGTEKERR